MLVALLEQCLEQCLEHRSARFTLEFHDLDAGIPDSESGGPLLQ